MEQPDYQNLNPIFSMWPEPLLAARYNRANDEWQIETGCVRRYIMAHLDQTDIKKYCLDSFFKKKTPEGT